MALKLLLNTKMTCVIFRKILKNTIQIKNTKYWLFCCMIAYMLSNKELNLILVQLFIRGRNLNIYYCTILFWRAKKILNFVLKSPNKQELSQIQVNYWSDTSFKDLMNLYKRFTAKPCSFVVIDAILASNNPSLYRKNLLERIKKLIMTIDYKI